MGRVTRQLGQLEPANTSAASIYSPASGVAARITDVVVTNTSGNGRAFRIFLDHGGASYVKGTALFYDEVIGANMTRILTGLGWFMNDASGNLAVRSDAASELTFSVFGIELS